MGGADPKVRGSGGGGQRSRFGPPRSGGGRSGRGRQAGARPAMTVMLSLPPILEGQIEDGPAELLGGFQFPELVRQPLVRHVLGYPIAHQQQYRARLSDVEPGDNGVRLLSANRADQHVVERGVGDAVRWKGSPIRQVLRHGLVAGHLLQRPIHEVITATVTHLDHVGPGPDHHGYRERGRHFPHVGGRGRGPHCLMGLQCGRPEVLEEVIVLFRWCAVAAERGRDVAGDGLRGEAARLAAGHPAPDSIRHQHQGGEARAPQLQPLGVGKAGPVDDHLRVNSAEEEVILVLFADLAGMGQAEQIEFVIARASARRCRGSRWCACRRLS